MAGPDTPPLVLADRWMAYLAHQEQSRWQASRILSSVGFGLSALSQGIVLYFNQDNGGPVAHSVLLGGAALVSTGLSVASWLVGPAEAQQVARWGSLGEYALWGTMALFGALSESCDRECPLALTTAVSWAYAHVLAGIVFELLAPPISFAEHYPAYVRLPDAHRAQHARDLLLQQETRQRRRQYVSFGLAAASAIGFIIAATQADNSSARIGYAALGGGMLLVSGSGLLVTLLERTGSESLQAGTAPPGF